jgi:hypothetical protein
MSPNLVPVAQRNCRTVNSHISTYLIPSDIYSATYSVVEYTPQTYIQSDLDLLFSTLGLPIPAGTGPSPFDSIDGGELQFEEEDFGINGESNLDLSYAIGLRKSPIQHSQ